MVVDEDARMTMAEALEHPWLTRVATAAVVDVVGGVYVVDVV